MTYWKGSTMVRASEPFSSAVLARIKQFEEDRHNLGVEPFEMIHRILGRDNGARERNQLNSARSEEFESNMSWGADISILAEKVDSMKLGNSDISFPFHEGIDEEIGADWSTTDHNPISTL